MNIQNNYCIAQGQPIVICFRHEEVRDKFLNTHTAHTGFFVEQCKGKDSTYFRLYTSGLMFTAEAYYGFDGDELGFYVKNDAKRMTQRNTIHSLTNCLHVFGLKDAYIIHSDDRRITRNMSKSGFYNLLDNLPEKKLKKSKDGESAENKLQTQNRKQDVFQAATNFYTVQKALLEAERAYRKEHFFSVPYDGVRMVTQSHDEGTVYSFQISQLVPDELQGKLKANTAVDIVLPEQKPIRATVVKFNARDNTLFMKVRVADLSDIPVSAHIVERENVSYRHIYNAINSIKNRSSENCFMEELLFEGEIPPIENRVVVSGAQFNEQQKDAINKAINTNDFLLIQGPPGTGKTKIIIEMVKHFVESGQRVLICSQNNHAVDNVLMECRALHFSTDQRQPIHCLRIGSAENVKSELRSHLIRPLTESIQHDMQSRSRDAFRVYEQRQRDKAAAAEVFLRDNMQLLELLEIYSCIHQLCIGLPQCFPKSILETFYTPAYLKNARQKADLCANISTSAVNIILSLIRNDIPENYLQTLLTIPKSLAHHLFDIYDVFSEKTFSKSLYLKFQHKETLDRQLDYLEKNRATIVQITQTLAQYAGNPGAEFMPVMENASTCEPFHFNARAFTDRLNDEIANILADCNQMKSELKQWDSVLQNDNKSIGEALLKSIKIVGATCIGSSTRSIFNELQYDVAIVDEAGQIPMHNLLVPLVKVKKFILVGDHIQLPPMQEKELTKHLESTLVPRLQEELVLPESKNLFAPFDSVGECYSKSLFEVLYNKKEDSFLSNHTVMLCEQYRSHPDIADFVSKHFYNGEYISRVRAEDRQLNIAGFHKPLSFIDTVRVPDKWEKKKKDSTSLYNRVEAAICSRIICDIIMEIRRNPETYKNLMDKDGNYDIGIISGYGDQVSFLNETLWNTLISAFGNSSDAKDEVMQIMTRISIDSLDSFQGMEKQIIVFSCVRSNRESDIGFMRDTRRINVLMTRAKSLLIMVGDSETLTNTDVRAVHNHASVADIFADFIHTCKCKGMYCAPTDMESFGKEAMKNDRQC